MIKILGYSIFSDSKKALIDKLTSSSTKLHVVSGNPEVLYTSLDNKILSENFKSPNTIIFPDAVGVVLAAKLLGTPVKEKIAGVELSDTLIKYCADSNKPIYLLGAEQPILEKCIENLMKKYPALNICGSHNGFFDVNNCEDIIEDINKKNPYILFVAMGCPRQELFIIKYMDRLKASLFLPVGGSLDIFAGKTTRAPQWMINVNLEWLYRVAQEPSRIKRLTSIPKFLTKALIKR